MMKLSNKGLELLKQREGCRLSPYLDSGGKPTIGYGTTYYENGVAVKLSDAPITQSRADELLLTAMAKFENAVNQAVAVPLSQNQFDALVVFVYNVGVANFKSSTLLQKLNSGDVVGAAAEFSRWYFDNKVPVKGLLLRRMAEMSLFLTDSFQAA